MELPSAKPAEGAPRSALYDLGAHLRLWLVGAAALALDLWSKSWAFATLEPREVRDAIPHVLTFQRSINPGALFGMGKGMVPLFIVASFVALGFVLYLFRCSGRRQWSLHLALSFVLAGSLGNLYDRTTVIADKVSFKNTASHVDRSFIGKVVEDDGSSEFIEIGAAPDGANPRRFLRRSDVEISQVGVVRDFLKITPQIAGRDIWPWIFNVADSLLVVGVALLMLNFWAERKANRQGEGDPSPAAD